MNARLPKLRDELHYPICQTCVESINTNTSVSQGHVATPNKTGNTIEHQLALYRQEIKEDINQYRPTQLGAGPILLSSVATHSFCGLSVIASSAILISYTRSLS